MTQEFKNSEEVDLQLVKQIIELTKVVEENKTMTEKITADLKQANSNIEKCEKQLQDWDLKLGADFEEMHKQIQALEEKIDQQNQNVKNVNTKFSNLFSEFKEKFEQQIQNTDKKFEDISTQFTEIQEVQNKHEEKVSSLNQDQQTIQSGIKDYIEKTQKQFESLANTIELIGNGLSQLEQQNESHSSLLEEHRNSLSQFKLKLKELVSLAKEDQKNHFENFSRIIESYNENIRTELSITAQSLKESDTQILDEVSASFMPKKVGKELQKTITDLASELKTEAQKTRDDLIQGLQENVQNYEKIMEEQNLSIKNYKQQLEHFQNEILAVIDRKVNEKYEVVFSLLSKVAVQAEELVLLIKTSEIQIPSPSLQTGSTTTNNNITKKNMEVSSSEIPMSDDKE